MNDAVLKNYATWARRELIEGVKLQMARWAIDEKGSVPASAETLHGEPLSARQRAQRARLLEMCDKEGFDGLAEKAAYTWFNRLTAIRFMEVNDYLPCGMRMFSAADGSFDSQALREALHVDIEGLDRAAMAKLVQEGEREPQFRYLLLCQCNELVSCMPGIFEPIGSAMELLLPDDLLRKGSVVERMVLDIPDSYWKEGVEILGWMYQYYNAELKEEFLESKRKAVQKDIAPATQLFTPNWIVRYMVENSLGRLWMLNNPGSGLRERMAYYIEPDGDHEDFIRVAGPEDITFCDPACGSGHILVYAFSLLFEMYLEHGYREREIPELILTKNLSGLEIDDRAAQIASLALVMCAREHDRRFFARDVAIDVHVVKPVVFGKEKNGEEVRPVPRALEKRKDLIEALTYLDEIGSLFAPSAFDMAALDEALAEIPEGDMFAQDVREHLELAKGQCEALSRTFDVVVANPPYMGSSKFNPFMNKWMKKNYPDEKSDLCFAFINRICSMKKHGGEVGIAATNSWMFLSSSEASRLKVLGTNEITSLVQLSVHGFKGIAAQVFAFTLIDKQVNGYRGGYVRLDDFDHHSLQEGKTLEAIENPECGWFYRADASTFHDIPGSPIAYWASEAIIRAFKTMDSLGTWLTTREGMATANNDQFVRSWWESPLKAIGFGIPDQETAMLSGKKWFPYQKGGEYRKWYGNNDLVVNWENDGSDIRSNIDEKTGRIRSHNYNGKYGFIEGMTWSSLSSGRIHLRFSPQGSLFDSKGAKGFAQTTKECIYAIALVNSSPAALFLTFLAPTLDYKVGDVIVIPDARADLNSVCPLAEDCISLSRTDWDIQETSWDFKRNPLI